MSCDLNVFLLFHIQSNDCLNQVNLNEILNEELRNRLGKDKELNKTDLRSIICILRLLVIFVYVHAFSSMYISYVYYLH